MKKSQGQVLLGISIVTRASVLAILIGLALNLKYLNWKNGYNLSRLVGLAAGEWWKLFYEIYDGFFSMFGDPLTIAQSNAGMTWSIRIMGVPFTDPIAFLSVLLKNHHIEVGFGLGLIIPLTLSLTFGRVFCSYVCPASLLFFSTSRLRRFLLKFFYFPDVQMSRGSAYGVLCGGLVLSYIFTHGVWTHILPYFAIGQTIFHAIGFGTLSSCFVVILGFVLADLLLGNNFTCKYLCPTGQLLGFIGSKSVVSIKRDAADCIDSCNACTVVCHLSVNPKVDETKNCSLCGECLIACPTKCLSIGVRP
ncbi:MAG: 4Fe-4S binding protein [Candidatus Cloacimonetes bacterium]|nr:4Fe-4S binding protein [Candidatus Cloacimonadota bacterium]